MSGMTIEEFMQKHKKPYVAKTSERLVPIGEYAKQVGMTTEGVRLRLEKGRLDGEKVGSRWMVRVLDDTADLQQELVQLRAENSILKTRLSLIHNILVEDGRTDTPAKERTVDGLLVRNT